MGKVNHGRVKELTRELLIALGDDPDRPGIADTPRRVADFWREFIDYNPGRVDTAFAQEATSFGGFVAVTNMRVWSNCEHHLIPFWTDISIGYMPNGSVLGLSKFARIAHAHAHKLQLQERLVQEIAADVAALTGSDDVIVVGKGVHLCMVMRGIQTEGNMFSMATSGRFKDDVGLRAEFLGLL